MAETRSSQGRQEKEAAEDLLARLTLQEEEEDESPKGGGKKRTASSSLEAESPKWGKNPLPEASTTATNSSPEWDPRAQPLVKS